MPSNPDIIDYAKHAFSEGVTPDEVRKSLLDSGWDEKSVNDSLAEVQPPSPEPAPEPVTAAEDAAPEPAPEPVTAAEDAAPTETAKQGGAQPSPSGGDAAEKPAKDTMPTPTKKVPEHKPIKLKHGPNVMKIVIPAVIVIAVAGIAAGAYFMLASNPMVKVATSIQRLKEIRSAAYEGKIVLSPEMAEPEESMGFDAMMVSALLSEIDALTFDFSGEYRWNDEGERDFALNVDLSIDDNEGTNKAVGGVSFLRLAPHFFIRPTGLPEGAPGTEYSDSWIRFEPSKVKELMDEQLSALQADEEEGEGAADEEEDMDLTEEQKEKLVDMFIDMEVISSVSEVGPAERAGGTATEYLIEVDRDAWKRFLVEAEILIGEEIPGRQYMESITIGTLSVYIGGDGYPAAMKADLSLPISSYGVDLKTAIELDLTDINAEIEIVAPAEFEDLDELLGGAKDAAEEKSRDVKRVSDVKMIQTGLELFFADHDMYPPGVNTVLGMPNVLTLCETGFSGEPCATTTYLSNVPSPPTPADGDCTVEQNAYTYTRMSENDYSLTFCISTQIGDLEPGVLTGRPNGIRQGLDLSADIGLSNGPYADETLADILGLEMATDIGLDQGPEGLNAFDAFIEEITWLEFMLMSFFDENGAYPAGESVVLGQSGALHLCSDGWSDSTCEGSEWFVSDTETPTPLEGGVCTGAAADIVYSSYCDGDSYALRVCLPEELDDGIDVLPAGIYYSTETDIIPETDFMPPACE